ncbi:MAG: hypothetical protein IMZ58_12250 [Thermoplasmata archaeon]|nr:hypothetical protein [Thermoplasmata archaeon]
MVKKTREIITALSFFIILILFFSTNVFAIGIYPPQLRLQDAPMGELKEVASMTIVNTDDNPNYFVFKVSCLEQTRQNKLRVICTGCNKDIGIQRGDLENGTCPFCSANDSYLIKYNLPPANILSDIILTGKAYAIEPYKETMYRTTEIIPAKQSVDIFISVNIPDENEYYGQHWEVRIMATAIPNLDELNNGMSMTYGAETKFLIDTPELTQEQKQNNNGLLFGGIIGFLVLIACVSYTFYKKRVLMRKNGKERLPVIKEGRKIL